LRVISCRSRGAITPPQAGRAHLLPQSPHTDPLADQPLWPFPQLGRVHRRSRL
jgi:hypothetical protein